MNIKLISIILACVCFFSCLGVVDAGNIDVSVATRLISTLYIYDVDDNYTCIYKATLNKGDSKRSIPIPEECKWHEFEIHHKWSGGIVTPQDSFVKVNSYNGGNMSLHFGLKWWGSKAMTYSYVYGEYTNKDKDGRLLSVYRVTKDQAQTKSHKNYIHRIVWDESNQILYNPNLGLNNNSVRVGDKVHISGKITEKNPNYNGVSYNSNFGGITFDIVINNGTNNTAYPVTTRSDGSWSMNYTPHNSGQHNITAYWKGNSTHPIFNTNKKTLNVKQVDTNSTIKISPEDAMVNKPIQISGESAPNLELELKIGNETMNVNTDNRGCWSKEYTPHMGGVHTITVSLKNHYMYKDFKNTTTLIVHDNRINLNSTINLPEKAIIDEEILISGVLKDEHGKTVPKTELKLTINNEEYTVTTDKNGYWSLPYIPNYIGEHTITVGLRGHPYFHDFTNTTTFIAHY